MSYVDAGYAVALGALFVYAVSLVLRRRRWERALQAVGAAGRRARGRRRPRRAVVTGHAPPSRPPAAQPADVRGPPGPGRAAAAPAADQPAGLGRLRPPGRRLRLPARRGAGQLARLLRHRRPGPGPPGDAGHPDLPPRGHVVPGTIHATAAGTDFAICQGANVVHVANTGSPPQLFQPSIPVVVVGHFTSDDVDALRLELHPGEALGDLHRPVPEPGKATQRARPLMLDAHLGTIGVWLAFVACIAGIGVIVVGLVRAGRAGRPAPPVPAAPRTGDGRLLAPVMLVGALLAAGRHGARAGDPRLHPGLRGREQQHGHAAALLHHRDVVGAGRLHPAVGPHPRRRLDHLRVALPAARPPTR